MTRACRTCGCTETHACVNEQGPCWWVEADLCSHCAEPAFKAVLASPHFDFSGCDVAAQLGALFGQQLEPGRLEEIGLHSVEEMAVFVAVAAITMLDAALPEAPDSAAHAAAGRDLNFKLAVGMLSARLNAAAADMTDPAVVERVNARLAYLRSKTNMRFDA